EPSPRLNSARDDAAAGRRIADVALDDLADAALGFDQALRLFRPFRDGVDQRHLCTVPRKNHRGGAAVADAIRARSGAGHDGELALEAVVLADLGHVFSRPRFSSEPITGAGLSGRQAQVRG